MKDKNQIAMSVKFELEAIKFVDITEFNNSSFKPNEIDAKRKEFISKTLDEKIPEMAKFLQQQIEEDEFCVFKSSASSRPFDSLAYSMEAMLIKSLNGNI